jgi:hypothetical protein
LKPIAWPSARGNWLPSFRRSPDYYDTQLIRDMNQPGRYLTLDRWTSREAFGQFKKLIKPTTMNSTNNANP